jgi:hypothetical protein
MSGIYLCPTCQQQSNPVLAVDALRQSLIIYECGDGHLSAERKAPLARQNPNDGVSEMELFARWAKKLVRFKRGRHG